MKRILFFIITILTIYDCNSQILSKNQKIIHEIHSIRQRFHIPGIVFGVANSDTTLLFGALGVREVNTFDSIMIHDMFHIASLGKGLTSFMIGKLVDEGKISWETQFFNLFPEMKAKSREEHHELKLMDLLSMRTKLRSLNDWSVKQIINGYNEKYKEDRFSY